MAEWVPCPVCGEPDMRKEDGLISCTNLVCESNGGGENAELDDPETWESLLADVMAASEVWDALNTKLTIMYQDFEQRLGTEFSREEQAVLGIWEHPFGSITLSTEHCSAEKFGFEWKDSHRDEWGVLYLPVAYLRDPDGYVAGLRKRIPKQREKTQAELVRDAERAVAKAQAKLDKLVAGGAG